MSTMRPHRLPRYNPHSQQGRQEHVNRDQNDYDGEQHSASRHTRVHRHGSREDRERWNERGHDSRHRDNRESWNERGHGSRHQQDRNHHRRRERSSSLGQGRSSGYDNYPSEERLYRDYDGRYQRRDYTYTTRDQNYQDEYIPSSYNDSRYDYDARYRSSRPETYTRNNHDFGEFRRPERRQYHTSTSASYANATSRNDTDNTVAGDTSQSVASRLFQHRGSYAPTDAIRSTRRSPPPNLNLPPRESMEKKLGPSEEYLKISLEKSNGEGLVRKLLVLDLNGTLVYRSPHRSFPGRRGRDVYAQFNPSKPRPLRTAHPRPYLTSLRNYLFHPSTKCWLDTMVWSSAQPHSVDDMVDKCFEDKIEELVAIWARDRMGLDANDYGRKVQTTKDLSKPWVELNTTSFVDEDPLATSHHSSPSPPSQKRNHSAKTTLLLDDSPLKAHLQPYNHVCLKEYDLEMRKHDLAVQELEVAREKYADVIAGKKTVEDFLDQNKDVDEQSNLDENNQIDAKPVPENPGAATDKLVVDAESAPVAGDGSARKRKRKEKKENKVKERLGQRLNKLTEEENQVYDDTLLAVVGILDAVKMETNVAAWIRSGGLINSLLGGDSGVVREASVETASSEEAIESPRKKRKVSPDQEQEKGKQSLEDEGSAALGMSDQPPPVTSSPPHEASSPARDDRSAESETERTGVPLVGPREGRGAEGEKSVQDQLWFNHPGTMVYWASRGREVLQEMEIDVIPGVNG